MTALADRMRDGAATLLTLFTSGGTLVCCALPITLVTLGFGSAVIGLTGAFPWLITLSQHKAWVFAVSATLLVFGGWMIHHRGRSCPADPRLGRLCTTLDPSVQAWTLIKIASPAFHLNFHDRKEDLRIALIMLPQARAQAKTLETRLLTDQGLFAARDPDGTFAEPRARDQSVALWGVSNLILAATSGGGDYWHAAYRDLIEADDYRGLADRALHAVDTLPPTWLFRSAPVFTGEERLEQGTWRVSDPTFRTADAMFLTNMLVMPHAGQPDAFLPTDRLKSLDR